MKNIQVISILTIPILLGLSIAPVSLVSASKPITENGIYDFYSVSLCDDIVWDINDGGILTREVCIEGMHVVNSNSEEHWVDFTLNQIINCKTGTGMFKGKGTAYGAMGGREGQSQFHNEGEYTNYNCETFSGDLTGRGWWTQGSGGWTGIHALGTMTGVSVAYGTYELTIHFDP